MVNPVVERTCPLAPALAARMRASRRELVAHWLERIVERVSIDRNRVFPTDKLLDHVPILIDGIADYLENPAAEVSADTPVVAKAMELGALRHSQGFDAYEILKEYEILGGILFNYLAQAADEMAEPCAKSELLVCGHRLFRAVAVIQQATTMHFLRLADERVAEREERLRAFNRSISHEIKNRIGTALGATESLQSLGDQSPGQRLKFEDMIGRSLRSMRGTVENLLALSRLDVTTTQHRHVRLPNAIQEAKRQVRETAEAAGLTIRVDEGLPDVEVNAAAVELCLTNYLTNAIKYADSGKVDRYAEVGAVIETGAGGKEEVVIRVRDNGHGVPPAARKQLFQRFFRAHVKTITGAEGTGLGLSIVRDTAQSLGGRAWAEFPDESEGGSVFAFSLPHTPDDGAAEPESPM